MLTTAATIIALLLADPGDKLIRSNPGKIIPNRGAAMGTVAPAFMALFDVPGDYASGDTTLVVPATPITVVRNSVATYENPPGTIVTAAANRLRVTADGALIEQAATNYALQSATHPKTNEASGALPTGKFTAWHSGTGTLTVTAGTATVTGLSCTTVAAGTLCPFTVTGGGTVLVTTTAGTTHVQIEPGLSVKSSLIATGATPVVREADNVSTTQTVVTKVTPVWCSTVDYTVPANSTDDNGQYVFALRNSAVNFVDIVAPLVTPPDVLTWYAIYNSTTPSTSHSALARPFSHTFKQETRLTYAIPGPGVTEWLDGVIWTPTSITRAANAVWSVSPATVYIGSPAGVPIGVGYVKNLKLYNVACAIAK